MDKRDSMIKLINVRTNYQLNMAKAILEEEEIPYVLVGEGSSGYMMNVLGSTILGGDIYVDEADYERAKELIELIENEEEVEQIE